MKIDMVAVAPIGGWNDERLPVNDIGDMANQAFVEDRMHGLAVVLPPLRRPPDPVSFGNGKISHDTLLLCDCACSSMMNGSPKVPIETIPRGHLVYIGSV